jgi:imidazolonepropionase
MVRPVGDTGPVTSTLLTDIGLLATQDEQYGELADAALLITDGVIGWLGPAAGAPDADDRVELGGRCVLPGFVDSHAHLVFAGDRSEEFAARMSGRPYSAGGIRSTVAATRQAGTDSLRRNLSRLAAELHRAGVTTFECKSGYGLDTETEQRSVLLAAEQTGEVTFLGAHVVPAGTDRADYLELVCGEMLEACAPHAKWVDAFCEQGAFDVDESRAVLQAGIGAGLQPRLHANQLTASGAVQLAVELDAASADHCTHLTEQDIAALAGSGTVATLLPLVEFSTRSRYPEARRLLDAGARIALATDCNPGSGFSTSMPLAIALAVREMHLTPAEAVHAATAGGAQALRRDDIGRLAVGQRADLVVLDAPSYIHLAYRPGVPLIHQTWIGGVPVS